MNLLVALEQEEMQALIESVEVFYTPLLNDRRENTEISGFSFTLYDVEEGGVKMYVIFAYGIIDPIAIYVRCRGEWVQFYDISVAAGKHLHDVAGKGQRGDT